MRNSKSHVQCTKSKIPKCTSTFYSYSVLQRKYGELLSKRNDVLEFRANVKLDQFPLGNTYTTDFVITTTEGRTVVRECIYKDKLLKPCNIKLLDASRAYWQSRGIIDWGLVVDA